MKGFFILLFIALWLIPACSHRRVRRHARWHQAPKTDSREMFFENRYRGDWQRFR